MPGQQGRAPSLRGQTDNQQRVERNREGGWAKCGGGEEGEQSPGGPLGGRRRVGEGACGERWLELSEQERQAEAAPFRSLSPPSPNLPPAASCTQDLGLHQEPSPHGLSHSKHLSFSLSRWHLPPCSHCTNPLPLTLWSPQSHPFQGLEASPTTEWRWSL